jgi:hypothetical protein
MFTIARYVEEKGNVVCVCFIREFINFSDHLLPYSGKLTTESLING